MFYRRLVQRLALSSLCLAACSAPPELPDALDTHAEALISFPAAAYANALQINYGDNVARDFRKADGFVALKFNGTAGDRIRFAPTAARAVRAYLVFNRKVQQVLVDANDATGGFSGTLGNTGEHYIMVRSSDRADLAMRLGLSISGPGNGGSSLYSNREIVEGTATGQVPYHPLARVQLRTLNVRSCTTVSGCGAPRGTARVGIAVDGPESTLRWIGGAYVEFKKELFAPPDGSVVSTHDVVGDRSHTLSASSPFGCAVGAAQGFAPRSQCWHRESEGAPTMDSGTVVLAVDVSGVPTPVSFDYEAHWTKEQGTVKLRSKPRLGALTWTEYEVEVSAPAQPLSSRLPREVPSAQPPLPEVTPHVTPLSDEEVLSRLRPGELTMPVLYFPANTSTDAFEATQFAAGFGVSSGRCGPRTGCNGWGDVRPYSPRLAAAHFFSTPLAAYESMRTPMVTIAATSNESYELRFTVRGGADDQYVAVPIENGRGILPARTAPAGPSALPAEEVLVTEAGLLIRNGLVRGAANTWTAKFPLRSEEPGYAEGTDVQQHDYLLRFNHRWPAL